MDNEDFSSLQEIQAGPGAAPMSQATGRDVYIAGIIEAIGAGDIVFAKKLYSPLGPLDGYSHFSKRIGRDEYAGGITEYNSRPLGAVVKDIIAMQAAMARVVLLESGCGMGVAAYDAFTSKKQQKHGVVVDCLGLTPFNPYLQIEDALVLLASPNTPPSIALRRCYPFARMQYIGAFPDDFEGQCKLPKNEYTLIHDNRGPCTHNSLGSGSAVANNYRQLLTEDGILMVSDPTAVSEFSGVAGAAGDMRFRFTPQAGSTQKHFAILARAESVLAVAARKVLPANMHDEVIGPNHLRRIIASALESPHS